MKDKNTGYSNVLIYFIPFDMKVFMSFAICMAAFITAIAQDKIDTTNMVYIPSQSIKAVIHFSNDSLIRGKIIRVNRNTLLFEMQNDLGSTQMTSIPIPEIQSIKIKRDKFWLGVGLGAILGGLAGYEIAASSYNYNYSISDNENSSNKKIRGYGGAVIAAIPSALIGGIIGITIIKTKFLINGKMENIKAMTKKLWEF